MTIQRTLIFNFRQESQARARIDDVAEAEKVLNMTTITLQQMKKPLLARTDTGWLAVCAVEKRSCG